jgi:hypothetical protein
VTPTGTEGTVDEQTLVAPPAEIIKGEISVTQHGVNVIETSFVRLVLTIL